MKPLMSDSEVRILEELLISLPGRPLKILEWGSGGSTIHFTEFLRSKSIPYEWKSVEYNKRWADTVIAELKGDPHTRVVLFDVGNDEILQRENPMDEYVNYPKSLGKTFDLIFVDGRKRRRCVIEARSLVTQDGAVVCHDAERRHYQCAFKLFPRSRYLGGRLWVGSTTPIDFVTNVIDVFTTGWYRWSFYLWRKLYRLYTKSGLRSLIRGA